MRILVVGGLATSLLNFRGPLLRELVQRGHDVIACAPDAPDHVRDGLDVIGVRYQHIPITRAGLNPILDLKTLLALRRTMREVRPDRVLAYTAKPVIYSGLAARLAGKPPVYAMITGLGYGFGNSTRRQRTVGSIVRVLYKRSLAQSAGVLFQNPDDLALFQRLNLVPPATPLTVINGSGVDLDWYTPQPLPHAPVFLLIARLLADKGIREYHQAAKQVKQQYPDAQFQLVGNVDPNPSSISPAELQAWAKEGVIEYLGELQDVRPALAAARVYVLPSYYREGTPRSVLEAMATGRPIITTDAPGCRETVVQGVNGSLVPVRDAGALAAAMIRMIQAAQPEIERMADASLAMVRERYDVRKVNVGILGFMGFKVDGSGPT